MFCSLLQTHPNDTTRPDLTHLSYLDCAPHVNDPIALISQFNDPNSPRNTNKSTPNDIQNFLSLTNSGHRDRDPIALPPCALDTTGMSPKKSHEVSRMISYLKHIYLPTLPCPSQNVRIVDVGCGQGYLCRAMAEHLGVRVLGIDGNVVQTDGAEMWGDGRRGKKRRDLPHPTSTSSTSFSSPSSSVQTGTVEYRTTHVTTPSLLSTIDSWIPKDEPAHVVLVALHACGSLTPNIIRARFADPPAEAKWRCVGAVVVGCCYNLLEKDDFPLSTTFSSPTHPRVQELSIPNLQTLPTCAFHLATQTPHLWNHTTDSQRKARLALRKIVFRAMWGRYIARLYSTQFQTSQSQFAQKVSIPGTEGVLSTEPTQGTQNQNTEPDGLGETTWSHHLGRLPDKVYDSWESFLLAASTKTGIPVHLPSSIPTPTSPSTPGFPCTPISNPATPDSTTPHSNEQASTLVVSPGSGFAFDQHEAHRIELLHVLRCEAGRTVEDLILDDREAWVNELLLQRQRDHEGGNVGRNEERKVQMVNLFDQRTGSMRNVAIVV